MPTKNKERARDEDGKFISNETKTNETPVVKKTVSSNKNVVETKNGNTLTNN